MKGIVNHASKAYIFSYFLLYTVPASTQLSFEADEGINIPSLLIVDSVSIPDFQIQIEKRRNPSMIQTLILHLKGI